MLLLSILVFHLPVTKKSDFGVNNTALCTRSPCTGRERANSVFKKTEEKQNEKTKLSAALTARCIRLVLIRPPRTDTYTHLDKEERPLFPLLPPQHQAELISLMTPWLRQPGCYNCHRLRITWSKQDYIRPEQGTKQGCFYEPVSSKEVSSLMKKQPSGKRWHVTLQYELRNPSWWSLLWEKCKCQ